MNNTKHTQRILDILKQVNTIQCHTMEDDMDIEVDYFNPDADIDPEIPSIVIAGNYGAVFTDDLETATIEGNTIKTNDYKITFQK